MECHFSDTIRSMIRAEKRKEKRKDIGQKGRLTHEEDFYRP